MRSDDVGRKRIFLPLAPLLMLQRDVLSPPAKSELLGPAAADTRGHRTGRQRSRQLHFMRKSYLSAACQIRRSAAHTAQRTLNPRSGVFIHATFDARTLTNSSLPLKGGDSSAFSTAERSENEGESAAGDLEACALSSTSKWSSTCLRLALMSVT